MIDVVFQVIYWLILLIFLLFRALLHLMEGFSSSTRPVGSDLLRILIKKSTETIWMLGKCPKSPNPVDLLSRPACTILDNTSESGRLGNRSQNQICQSSLWLRELNGFCKSSTNAGLLSFSLYSLRVLRFTKEGRNDLIRSLQTL